MLMAIVFLCYSSVINFFITLPTDSHFKSIHQLQSEEYSKDTITDTTRNQPPEPEKKQSEKIFKSKQPMQTIINFSLMVILILALMVSISIFLIAHKIYKTKERR